MALLTFDSVQKISKIFKLPIDGEEQDWDIELADPDRIEEFISGYLSLGSLDEDDKYALLALILGSFEDLEKEKAEKIWPEIKDILLNNLDIYIDLIVHRANLGSIKEHRLDSSDFYRSLIKEIIENYI